MTLFSKLSQGFRSVKLRTHRCHGVDVAVPVTKSELTHRIAQKQSQIVERDFERAVKMMLDHMAACLAGGGRIDIRGFAASRSVSAPRGSPVSLPARYVPYFKPGMKLRERVNRAYRGPPEA